MIECVIKSWILFRPNKNQQYIIIDLLHFSAVATIKFN